jgi:hypothetical protein
MEHGALPPSGASLLPTAEEKLIATVKGVKYLVEGHGYAEPWKDLLRITHFNRDLVTFAKAAYDRGDPPSLHVDQLKKNPAYAPLLDNRIKEGFPYGYTPFALADMNVNVAYLEFAGLESDPSGVIAAWVIDTFVPGFASAIVTSASRRLARAATIVVPRPSFTPARPAGIPTPLSPIASTQDAPSVR